MDDVMGIEAARSRLGEIADRAHTTGQTTHLTRHGRTVAVIGPAESAKPVGAVKVQLVWDNKTFSCLLPGVPRVGETFVEEGAGPDGDEELEWRVTDVRWRVAGAGLTPDPKVTVEVHLAYP
ncbi:type II toxin-antitoxin system Phd/YefM family antitoxin (plasmid) [Streptomyces phaeoluteigriseus]|uniref:Type II toxin-antitoxin system Phd/YefM family antitoxin n=1 Tax=Streptomyces phaeoluteigriseus TaxID=114686 RepID=A0ABY4ZLU7_9ACTN|nr:type II toxin-antitoxin system Phd/YefM family antitoxin [Streptomyces phaeoluteigriseus]USQ89890.1 type II toxin-antitoxin system Phd/YefM family antitoxin [Streptomyces phaeoluteigriseus]